MPIYEYQCAKCQHQFDTLQGLHDKPLRKCPECGKLALTKLVSAAGFRLKGGGWYETDFKSGNKKNLANSDTSGSGSSDSGTASSAPPSATSNSSSGGDGAKTKSDAPKKADTSSKPTKKVADKKS